MNRRDVQQQFGINAAAYATSQVHAQGASLGRLVELVQPRPEWQMLDVATGAGHTALAFGPLVQRVVAADITSEMLRQAAIQSEKTGCDNIELVAADAEELPFAQDSFDLVTCRIAAHHFTDVRRFMTESARVLRSGGVLAVVDNYVPGSRLRGKKGRQQQRAATYINAFERLRDPSHRLCLSPDVWRQCFYQAGIVIVHEEVGSVHLDFDDWTARMRVPPDDVIRLRVMLLKAPPLVAEFLAPRQEGRRLSFRLGEAIFVGRVSSSSGA